MSGALAIFVKSPAESPAKTRLAKGCGESYAAHWYRLAAAAVASVARVAGERYGLRAYWAVTGAADAWPELPAIAQGQGGLGERMARVHAELVERHEFGLLLGADAPQITAFLLGEAIDWLTASSPRLALGPAEDGGFWLFGGNVVPRTEMWTTVRYSAADTARDLQRSLKDLGDWRILPTLLDADRADDLAGVQRALRELPDATTEQRELARWMSEHTPA